MKPMFIQTPSGQLLAVHHLISLSVEESGALDQLRHEAQGTTVTGDKHLLASYRGPDSRRQAEALIAELLRQAEVPTFIPLPAS